MKTKNELGDWEKVVAKLVDGIGLGEATRNDAMLVRKRVDAKGRPRMVSEGQIQAIRIADKYKEVIRG